MTRLGYLVLWMMLLHRAAYAEDARHAFGDRVWEGDRGFRVCPSDGSCAPSNYTCACDGPEDCAAGGTCCGGDNLWTATCVPAGTTCGSLEQYCHTGNDCDAAKPYCCPGPVEDMRSCSATDAPSCT